MTKSSLGKGLQSLIPKKESKMTSLIKREGKSSDWLKLKKESIFNIEIDKIKPNSSQPRNSLSEEGLKELAESIKQHGVLQPLIVTKNEKTTERGRQVEYELIAGERRWRASQIAGLPSVPVIIKDTAAQEKLEIALVENIQREDLNAIDSALAYKQLQDVFNLRHKDIAKKVGKSRTAVTNSIRLLSLPAEVQKAIVLGKISEGHGRAILMAKPEAQKSLFQSIIKNNLSVRQVEEKARKLASENKPYSKGPKNPLFKKIEKDLEKVLGRRVSILKRGDINYINIQFIDQKELNRLAEYLLKI